MMVAPNRVSHCMEMPSRIGLARSALKLISPLADDLYIPFLAGLTVAYIAVSTSGNKLTLYCVMLNIRFEIASSMPVLLEDLYTAFLAGLTVACSVSCTSRIKLHRIVCI